MTAPIDNLEAVNRCQILELQKAAETLDPQKNCDEFFRRIRSVESVMMHTYQLVAYTAIRQENPADAVKLWKGMVDLCDCALDVLRVLRIKHQDCGASGLYDLVLDYKGQAQDRYYQNLQDSECATIPAGLFAEVT